MTKTGELRRQKGLSIRALALATGLSHSTISRIEKGQRKISTSQAVALSKFFEVPIEYLIGVGEDTMAKTQTKYPAKEVRFPDNRLKQLRESRGLSLRALSEKTGIDFATISFCERGQRNFSANSIKALSDFFGVSTDYLLGVEPHDDPHITGEPRQPLRRLAAFRARYNVTTTYLGHILHLDPSMLTHIEKGRKSFSVESLKRACDYMGVTADYLLEQPPEAMLSRFITSCMELLNSGEAQRLSPITAKKLTVIGLMGELDALDGQTQTDILNKILQTLGDK